MRHVPMVEDMNPFAVEQQSAREKDKLND